MAGEIAAMSLPRIASTRGSAGLSRCSDGYSGEGKFVSKTAAILCEVLERCSGRERDGGDCVGDSGFVVGFDGAGFGC
jgi:hypothetical protein